VGVFLKVHHSTEEALPHSYDTIGWKNVYRSLEYIPLAMMTLESVISFWLHILRWLGQLGHTNLTK
jgi:tRNA U34 5-methylaminomethyl-2-thiouridine-forming methyltransferase MnmC